MLHYLMEISTSLHKLVVPILALRKPEVGANDKSVLSELYIQHLYLDALFLAVSCSCALFKGLNMSEGAVRSEGERKNGGLEIIICKDSCHTQLKAFNRFELCKYEY